jgi:hypothetical protein
MLIPLHYVMHPAYTLCAAMSSGARSRRKRERRLESRLAALYAVGDEWSLFIAPSATAAKSHG